MHYSSDCGSSLLCFIALLITAATGSPNATDVWTGGSDGGVFTPSGAPADQANFTVNAFTGMFVSTLYGKNGGCYGVVTSNTATAITLSAGSWLPAIAKLGCPFPDTSSTFVVEPGSNHGTVVSGGMTMVYLNENAIDCQNPYGSAASCLPIGRMEDVIVVGGKIRADSSMVMDHIPQSTGRTGMTMLEAKTHRVAARLSTTGM